MLSEGYGILINSFELLWWLVSGMKLAFVTLLVGLEHDESNDRFLPFVLYPGILIT